LAHVAGYHVKTGKVEERGIR